MWELVGQLVGACGSNVGALCNCPPDSRQVIGQDLYYLQEDAIMRLIESAVVVSKKGSGLKAQGSGLMGHGFPRAQGSGLRQPPGRQSFSGGARSFRSSLPSPSSTWNSRRSAGKTSSMPREWYPCLESGSHSRSLGLSIPVKSPDRTTGPSGRTLSFLCVLSSGPEAGGPWGCRSLGLVGALSVGACWTIGSLWEQWEHRVGALSGNLWGRCGSNLRAVWELVGATCVGACGATCGSLWEQCGSTVQLPP